MERNFFSEGFEGFLREKADQYKMYPSDRVWKNIDRELRPRRKWPYMAAVLLLLGIGIGARQYVNEQEKAPIGQNTGGQEKSLKVASLNPEAKTGTATAQPVSGTPTKKSQANPLRVVARQQPDASPIDQIGDRHEVTIAAPVQASPVEERSRMDEQAQGSDIQRSISVVSGQALPELRPHTAPMDIHPNTTFKAPALEQTLTTEQYQVNPIVPPYTFTPKPRKWGFEMYVTPSVSYRRLTGKASNANYANYNNVGYSANFGYPADVNAAVVHKPSMGIELGSAFTYPLSKMFRFKAGLQLNYNQYLIQAYSYVPEMASFGANNAGFFSTPINEVSFYRNFNGYSRTWLKNEHFMISMPIGFEMNLAGRENKVQFGIASSIQPTYILSDNAFLISTNLKNYAEASALYRNWNVNGAVEAFLSVNSGPVKWFMAPQFRYQILSSYSDNYPIREHLVEYGLKLGIKRTIR